MSGVTILDMANLAAQRPGVEPPTPRWAAVLRYLYGLPLSEADVIELEAATGRSREAIVSHATDTLGKRRFRQLWARIGRRGRKSSTAALIAVFEALYGGHEQHILPGEQALAAVISKDLAGANVVARFAKVFLDALGFRYSTSRIGNVQLIEIEGGAIALAMLAATNEAPRGFAICCLVLDEFAYVSSADEHVDTDKSILAGAEPAMAQFPGALVIGISTGHGRTGVHYERVERGLGNDNEREILSVTGSSWEWSRDIDRAEAERIADGDLDVLTTEFLGGVSENEALWMPQADALAMFERRSPEELAGYRMGEPFRVVDFADGGSDVLAYMDAAWCEPTGQTAYKRKVAPAGSGVSSDIFVGWELDDHGQRIKLATPTRPLLYVFNVGGYEPAEIRSLGMEAIVAALARGALSCGARQILGDDRAGPYVEALFSKWPTLRYSFVHYSNQKHPAALLCRSWARDRQIYIEPEHAEFKKQALRYRRYVSGSTYKYGKQGQRDDYVTLLLTLGIHLCRQSDEQWRPTSNIDAPTRRFAGPVAIVPGR